MKLDMALAYKQLVVDKETAKMQAITTHKGTFALTRLRFGVAAAWEIFQGLVLTFFDNFIIFRKTADDLADKLREDLQVERNTAEEAV